MEETFNLEEIFQLLKKKWIWIVGMTFLVTLVSVAVTFFLIPPKYSATTQLVVQTKENGSNINTDKINSNLLLINTYKDLVKSKAVTEKAKDQLMNLGLSDISEEFLTKSISVEQNQNSQLFSIKAISNKPKDAEEIANTISEVFQKEAVKVTDTDKVSIVSKAVANAKPVSPNKQLNIAVGVMMGIIFGIMLVLLSEVFNRTIKTEEYLSEKLELPILGILPIISEREMNEITKIQNNAFLTESLFFEKRLTDEDLLDSESDGLDIDLEEVDMNKEDLKFSLKRRI